MSQRAKQISLRILALGLSVAVLVGGYFALRVIWNAFAALPKELSVGILAAAATVLASTIAVVVGRQLERKKELDAVHRDKKIPIYDGFIRAIMSHFSTESSTATQGAATPDAVALIREWQTHILLWGGPEVVNAYLKWKRALSTMPQTIRVVAYMEELFLALRKELGHDDRKLERHAIVSLFLQSPEYFKAAYRVNPSMTMEQLVQLEKMSKEKGEV